MGLALPKLEPLVQRKLRLRWRFTYKDRPDRKGGWDAVLPQTDPGTAWRQPKDGLVWAIIEGESIFDHREFKIVEIPGSIYAFCQWEVHVRPPIFGGPEALKLTPRTQGLSMWTGEEKITAFVDGTVKRRLLTAEERKFQFHEHSAGT